MRGSEFIVKALEEEKVKYIFGYPGVSICPLCDSLMDSDIQAVLVRNEQNAAHAASGYARSSGKVGVCMASSGPGATNLITGIATAFADSIPIVCITGQVKSEQIGSDMFQEVDIVGATESFVKYSYLVKNVRDLPRIMKEAFYIASTGRKGPVLIDVPVDIQLEEGGEFVYPESVSLRTYKPTVKGHAVQIKKVVEEMKKAKRPILCVGGGVILSGAEKEVLAFAEKRNLPIVSTMMGIGVCPSDHPLYMGMVGNNGKKYANLAMNESDLLIIVGARVADRAVKQPDLITNNKILVHIDVDPAEIGKNAGPTIPIVGDALAIFREMNQYEGAEDYSDWLKRLKEYQKTTPFPMENSGSYVNPNTFITLLTSEMEEDAVYLSDVGQNQMFSCGNYVAKKGKFLTTGGMGTMGYAIPAGIGAIASKPERQVVTVCGDGAFQMSMPELATLKELGFSLKILIMNNEKLGMIREYQHLYYNNRYNMNDLGSYPRISCIAEAYGIKYMKLEGSGDIRGAVREFLDSREAVIMEVFVDPNTFTGV